MRLLITPLAAVASSALAKKLSFDPAWIDLQRQLEFRMNT